MGDPPSNASPTVTQELRAQVRRASQRQAALLQLATLKLPDFEQNRPYILQFYAADLQKNVLAAERKTAKIDVKPMPRDLFPPEQPVAGGDLAPVLRERHRDGRADAACGTGHNHPFAFKRDQHNFSWRMTLSENRCTLFGVMR